ncbi:hypothetical protein [Arthrobacter sp. KBS0703]|nr:hypothetical protein [Arthrobacter sp. KBS0703]
MSASTQQNGPFDVVVMGEILVEVATDVAFGHGVPAQLGISCLLYTSRCV